MDACHSYPRVRDNLGCSPKIDGLTFRTPHSRLDNEGIHECCLTPA